MKWIVETSDLFDKLFGPDNFNFKTLNKCLVIPKASQPSFVYMTMPFGWNSLSCLNLNKTPIRRLDVH